MTREEEIYVGTQQYVKEYCDGLYDAETLAKKCAQWADEHKTSPWRDAKNDPPKNTKPVIGIDEDGIICDYEYSPEEGIWSVGIILSDAPVLWMPIPEITKGE